MEGGSMAITIDFPKPTREAIEELSKKEDVLRTDIIRRAVALYIYAAKRVHEDDENRRVAIVSGETIIETIVLA
jgi:metal-responsive CopG/Arc/MetJ family transcriptional regulator